jgi:hypothetical protein
VGRDMSLHQRGPQRDVGIVNEEYRKESSAHRVHQKEAKECGALG